MKNVFTFPTDTEHIYTELIPETGILHRLINQFRGRHQYDFRNADIIEIQGAGFGIFCGMIIHNFKHVIFRKGSYFRKIAHYIQQIILLQMQIRVCQILIDRLQQFRLGGRFSTYFKNIQGIPVPYIYFCYRFSYQTGGCIHFQPEQVIRQLILLYQFV